MLKAPEASIDPSRKRKRSDSGAEADIIREKKNKWRDERGSDVTERLESAVTHPVSETPPSEAAVCLPSETQLSDQSASDMERAPRLQESSRDATSNGEEIDQLQERFIDESQALFRCIGECPERAEIKRHFDASIATMTKFIASVYSRVLCIETEKIHDLTSGVAELEGLRGKPTQKTSERLKQLSESIEAYPRATFESQNEILTTHPPLPDQDLSRQLDYERQRSISLENEVVAVKARLAALDGQDRLAKERGSGGSRAANVQELESKLDIAISNQECMRKEFDSFSEQSTRNLRALDQRMVVIEESRDKRSERLTPESIQSASDVGFSTRGTRSPEGRAESLALKQSQGLEAGSKNLNKQRKRVNTTSSAKSLERLSADVDNLNRVCDTGAKTCMHSIKDSTPDEVQWQSEQLAKVWDPVDTSLRLENRVADLEEQLADSSLNTFQNAAVPEYLTSSIDELRAHYSEVNSKLESHDNQIARLKAETNTKASDITKDVAQKLDHLQGKARQFHSAIIRHAELINICTYKLKSWAPIGKEPGHLADEDCQLLYSHGGYITSHEAKISKIEQELNQIDIATIRGELESLWKAIVSLSDCFERQGGDDRAISDVPTTTNGNAGASFVRQDEVDSSAMDCDPPLNADHDISHACGSTGEKNQVDSTTVSHGHTIVNDSGSTVQQNQVHSTAVSRDPAFYVDRDDLHSSGSKVQLNHVDSTKANHGSPSHAHHANPDTRRSQQTSTPFDVAKSVQSDENTTIAPSAPYNFRERRPWSRHGDT
ncbi:hypothetical protein K458DRAFT_427533 [Lentithecium fluviatile CBS 122367]|uniref:Uncharacterized protein n=1 Tax=Lentithecium fluviatile CBS 122367 TaxID=1168545 RepID=A0A6G1JGS4_9PLEO|nr:hypothetical protein K458DRAFT_427533 [Lentithecium fluviatile CBS 122367]